MGSVFRKTVSRPIPTDAIRLTRQGKPYVKYKGRGGKCRTAKVIAGRDGRERMVVESGSYVAKYRDENGLIREISTGCYDKQNALSFLGVLTNRVEQVKANVLTCDQAKIAEFSNIPLAEHIKEYIEYLGDRGVHPDRIKTSNTRLIESAKGCGFTILSELSADKLHSWLVGETNDKKRNMSASVWNGYVELWVSMGNWLIGKRMNRKRPTMNGEKRLIANPFEGMGKKNESLDRKRIARALSESDLANLIDYAMRRPLLDALTIRTGKRKGERTAKIDADRRVKLERLGLERALIYKTASLTGLRLNELRTLTVDCLSFGEIPFVRLNAIHEKNRKGSSVAMRSDLAKDLKDWVSGKDPGELVFNIPEGFLRILNRDLKAAGIEKRDSQGFVVHLHALRHTFGTHLSKSGVSPRVAQAAMRHSDISLTMNTYVDARLLDTSAAVESLPSLPIQIPKSCVAPHVAPNSDFPCHNLSFSGNSCSIDDDSKEAENAAKTSNIPLDSLVGATGHQLNHFVMRYGNVSLVFQP